jgi:hypothetical protein
LTHKRGSFFKKLFEKKGQHDSVSTVEACSDMEKSISILENKAIIVKEAKGIDFEERMITQPNIKGPLTLYITVQPDFNIIIKDIKDSFGSQFCTLN